MAVGPDLAYLTAYQAMPLERLTMLVVLRDDEPFIVVPRLEEPAARAGLRVEIEVVTWGETDDAHEIVANRVRRSSVGRGARAAVSDALTAYHLLRLQDRLPEADWRSATTLLRELRMIKDADEIELLRLAGAAADRVVAQIAS